MRNRYLLCYDVCDESRLRRTARIAEAYGYRVQYSVFICDLSPMERIALEAELRRTLNHQDDRVFLVNLGPAGESTARRIRWIVGGPPGPDPTQALIL